MATLVATVGASNANSYCDLAFADDYFSNRVGAVKWQESDPTLRGNSLMMATDLLDRNYDWVGDIAGDVQSLRWPRKSVTDVDRRDITEAVIPVPIKRATCEMALSIILSGDYTGEVNDLDNVRVGPIRVDFDEGAIKYPIPRPVMEMLRHWGQYLGPSGGRSISVVNVVRT